ncbi:MAG TPA: glycosyltransferase [Dehalococcoidia bacterium]|nr:glycosyltransferase [Dehalococcoidia bacterium]
MAVETPQVHGVENPVYSVVIPIRDRCGHALRLCLKSVELQTLQPLELIIVDYGSTEENHEKLMRLLPDCTVYHCKTDAPWSLSVARNIGLRRATARTSCSLDADLIMEPRVLEVAHRIHTAKPRTYMSTNVTILDFAAVDPATLTLPEDYDKLALARWTFGSEGWGGFVSASTDWWHECQGFDERMTVWGSEDVDMWKRAARAGMSRYRLYVAGEEGTTVYHVHHPSIPVNAIRAKDKKVIAAIKQNSRWARVTKGVRRNDEAWGLWRED